MWQREKKLVNKTITLKIMWKKSSLLNTTWEIFEK